MKERTAVTIGFLVAPIIPGLMLGIFTPITSDGPEFLTVLGLLPIGYSLRYPDRSYEGR
jgi:hypothetical protein